MDSTTAAIMGLNEAAQAQGDAEDAVAELTVEEAIMLEAEAKSEDVLVAEESMPQS